MSWHTYYLHCHSKIIRNSWIQTGGHIVYKEVQLLVYADDIDIISKFKSGLREGFQALETSLKAMKVDINKDQTNK